MERWTACVSKKMCPKQPPLVYFCEEIFDIREWLAPHLSEIHGHTGPHAFKVTLSENGDPVMKYKIWSSDEDWIPSGEEIPLFNVIF